MSNEKTLGQIAFEAYSGTRDWKDVRGGPIPAWNELKPEIRDAWEVGAGAVEKKVVESGQPYR